MITYLPSPAAGPGVSLAWGYLDALRMDLNNMSIFMNFEGKVISLSDRSAGATVPYGALRDMAIDICRSRVDTNQQ